MREETAIPTEDAALVCEARRGLAPAFGSLVERHRGVVYAVLLARTNDPELAEELAAETFVTAWFNLDALRNPDRFGAWVVGIATRLYSRHLRQRRRHGQNLPETFDLADTLTDDPAGASQREEERTLLLRALGELPEQQRAALHLRYLEGFSYDVIGGLLGMPFHAIKNAIHRGKARLRESLSHHFPARRPEP